MVVQLMKYGADPSLIDGEGCSCVHLAAQFGHTSIVAYLIAKGQVGSTSTSQTIVICTKFTTANVSAARFPRLSCELLFLLMSLPFGFCKPLGINRFLHVFPTRGSNVTCGLP